MTGEPFFKEVLSSEIAMVKCRSCGNDAPVNSVYLPYLDGSIERCRQCRCSDKTNFD